MSIGVECFNQVLQAFSSLKTLVSIFLLCHAAAQDFENRELEASAWVPVILLGALTLILELTVSPFETILAKVFLNIILLSLFFLLGLYGLGDALILAGVSFTHVSTTRPLLQGRLLQLSFPEFGITVLLNAELLSSATMVLNMVRNLRSGAWSTVLKGEPFHRRLAYMLLLRAVEQRIGAGLEGCSADGSENRMVFVKQTIPMALFIFFGYVVTLLFGSLIPLP